MKKHLLLIHFTSVWSCNVHHSLMVYFFLEFLDLNHSFKYRYHSIVLQFLNGLLKTHNTEEGMSTLPKNLSVLTIRM